MRVLRVAQGLDDGRCHAMFARPERRRDVAHGGCKVRRVGTVRQARREMPRRRGNHVGRSTLGARACARQYTKRSGL